MRANKEEEVQGQHALFDLIEQGVKVTAGRLRLGRGRGGHRAVRVLLLRGGRGRRGGLGYLGLVLVEGRQTVFFEGEQ